MAGTSTAVLVALPRPLTPLIGRERELQQLCDLLVSDVALVTITGFGGMGKTRIALQAALELEPEFEAGAVFVSLASVTQGSSIPKAIALTAGLHESIDTLEALAPALGNASRLLVLDNLEQIPDAADMVWNILQAMPQITILATSRHRLELAGEHTLPLPTLETESDQPASLPSVKLFLERAKSIDPSLSADDDTIATVTDICRKLDGIPLAIELAAARLTIFSVSDLRDQLQTMLPVLATTRADLPDRQRTMRNAIAWTYDLLEAPYQNIFCWLSVYEPDFGLESIRHIAHQLELPDDPLDLVQALVSRGLIRPSKLRSTAPRFHMLQMLREFGHEQLRQDSAETRARISHAQDMVSMAERAEPHFLSEDGKRWMLRLREESPNLLLAMAWSGENGHVEPSMRIFGAAWKFIRKSGLAKQFLEHLPDLYDPKLDPEMAARALVGAGNVHEVLSQLDLAEEAFRHVLEFTEANPQQRTRVAALNGMALSGHGRSDMQQLGQYAEEAQTLARKIGDDTGADTAAGFIAMHKIQTGDAAAAVPILTELVAHARDRGDTGSEASFSGNLGVALQIEERYDESRRYILRTIELAEDEGNLYSAAIGYVNLSSAALLMDDFDAARDYCERGLIVARKANQLSTVVSLTNNLASVYWKEKDFGTAAQLLAQAVNLLDTNVGVGQQVQIVSVYVDICLELGMFEELAELIGAARSVRDRLNLAAYPWQQEGEDAAVTQLDPDNNPRYARLLDQGALHDAEGMVRFMNTISRTLVDRYPPGVPAETMQPAPLVQLTPREAEVMEMMAQGLSNAEIADAVFISVRTVTTHITNIFNKLEVNNRTRAIAAATRAGVI